MRRGGLGTSTPEAPLIHREAATAKHGSDRTPPNRRSFAITAPLPRM
jgi:hypothetical protein